MKTNHEIERVQLKYRDSFAGIRVETFFLVREQPFGKSLIALAEQNCESLMMELVAAAQYLNDQLLELAKVHSSTMAMVCETNPLRDLSPWTLESFTSLVVLTQFRRELLDRKSISVEYRGNDPYLSESIGRICQQQNVLFEAFPTFSTTYRSRFSIVNRLRRAPALYLLREFLIRHSFARHKTERPQVGDTIALVAPFAHLQWSTEGEERFRSGYWGSLPDKLLDSGSNVLFVHHPSPVLTWRQRRRSVRAISRATHKSPNVRHVFSHPPLTVSQTLGSWRLWRNLRSPLAQLLKDLDANIQGQDLEWLWLTLRPSVERGLVGHRSLLDLALRRSMESDEGKFDQVKHWIFASENQSWERCFISSRRREGYARFDAFSHVPIRPWDLRYFTLAHELAEATKRGSHQSFDRLLVGGESDRRLLYAFLDLPDRVAVVEALRFGPNPPSEGSSAEFSAVGHMVVLGDYDRSESEIVVRAAEKVRGFFPEPPVATFRPHPLHAARDRDLVKRVTSINQDIRSDQICQPLVVASSRTSAFYSFLSSRIPVVIALGDQTLNFCPVSDFPGLSFVSASSAEANPSRAAISWPEGASGDLHGILALDDGLPRWLRALGLDQ